MAFNPQPIAHLSAAPGRISRIQFIDSAHEVYVLFILTAMVLVIGGARYAQKLTLVAHWKPSLGLNHGLSLGSSEMPSFFWNQAMTTC